MAMAGPIPMPTDAQILTLAQWFSPGYPVGAFSYSHGLEAAVAAGDVEDAASLEAWIEQVLCHGAGRSDALFLAASYRCETAPELALIDARCRAFAPSRERLQETALQGAAFAQITASVWGGTPQALCYPVAVGQAAARLSLPLRLTSAMYLQAFAANLATAGQRLTRVGQTEAQRIISTVSALCTALAEDTVQGDLSTLSNTAFLADIASMHHETQYSRMFRT